MATPTVTIIPIGMITIIRTHMAMSTIIITTMATATTMNTATGMRMGPTITTRPIPIPIRTIPTDRESATRTIWSRRGPCWPM